VVVVDDGSRDGMAAVLQRSARDWPELRVVTHAENRGKGAAVRTGVLAAAGDLLLFADADGATPIDEHARLAVAIAAGADVAIGSRLLVGDGIRRARSRMRGVTGLLFSVVAKRLLRLPVRDTQCGFKMFRGEVGRRLFCLTSESRYLFDLELLAEAQRLGYRIVEVPINWHEVPGGHLHPLLELPRIMAGLWRLRRLGGGCRSCGE
jgi:dolichyl-phosphate beta-glucosyltransferase